MREIFNILLNLKITDNTVKSELSKIGIKESDMNNKILLCYNMVNKALAGNVKAFETIVKTVEKKPEDMTDNEIKITIVN